MVTRRRGRANLSPADATNEGSRQLREMIRKQTYGALARRLRCDERAVRWWASERFKPSLVMRSRLAELGIAETAWDAPRSADIYAAGDPPTRRR